MLATAEPSALRRTSVPTTGGGDCGVCRRGRGLSRQLPQEEAVHAQRNALVSGARAHEVQAHARRHAHLAVDQLPLTVDPGVHADRPVRIAGVGRAARSPGSSAHRRRPSARPPGRWPCRRARAGGRACRRRTAQRRAHRRAPGRSAPCPAGSRRRARTGRGPAQARPAGSSRPAPVPATSTRPASTSAAMRSGLRRRRRATSRPAATSRSLAIASR